MDTESKKEINNNKLLRWKRILYFAAFLIVVIVVILIYFYFNTFNTKVSIKEKGYMFWEDNTIEPTLCDFKFEGKFERYLFSNQRNTLEGQIYINDVLVIYSAWIFFNGYAMTISEGVESFFVSEEYEGFILNIDLYGAGNISQKRNEKNKCLIIVPANHIEDTLLRWRRYDYNPEDDNFKQWQLDLLNDPNQTLNRLKGGID